MREKIIRVSSESLAIILGIIWLIAAIGKVASEDTTWEANVVEALGSTTVLNIVIALELSVAIGLIANRGRMFACIISIFLLAALTAYSYYRLHDPKDCHCFGDVKILEQWPLQRNATIVLLSSVLLAFDLYVRKWEAAHEYQLRSRISPNTARTDS